MPDKAVPEKRDKKPTRAQPRNKEQGEKIINIPLAQLHPFPDHPFKVRDDDTMQETTESIKSYGVLVPAIARPREDGGYEIISGHRRKHACELAGLDTMPVIVRDMDTDAATILMVDSNIQRENVLPSERAAAYKMKLDAIRRKAGRPAKEALQETENNSVQVGQNFDGKTSREILAENSPDSSTQIQRYIRLTELSPELQIMVDEKKIAMTPAVEISYLKPEEQTMLLTAIDSEQATPSLSQAQRMKKLSQEGKRQYKALTGRTQDRDVIAYHFRQSFRSGEVTPEEANRIGVEFAHRFLKDNNAFIVCTHIDRHHVHNHVIWNSTTLGCTRKFRNFWGSTKAVRLLSDTICVEHGLSIIENPKRHGKSYNKWLDEQGLPSHRDLLRTAIDGALERKPGDLAALLQLLQEAGYEVKRGKNSSLKGKGQERFVRLSSLGAGYTESELLAVLTGKAEHTPHKKTAPEAPQKVSLLIDIDAKLRAGKSGGYKQWASVFNAKQMAHTMNYLREHDLMDMAALKEKAEAATAKFNALSAQIKSAEARMAEIAVLKTQIINYAKTREVFAAYKASGYSKKYLADRTSFH